MRNFLKYLAKRDIKSLAAEKIEFPKTPRGKLRCLEYGDLERLLAAPKGDSFRALRDRAILEVFFSPACGSPSFARSTVSLTFAAAK